MTAGSAFFRGYVPKLLDDLDHLLHRVPKAAPALIRRMASQARPVAPGVRGANRARGKTPAAVRTHVVEGVLDAVGAERALVRADSGVRRGRRKIGVTQFAVRAQSKHVWDATGNERIDR